MGKVAKRHKPTHQRTRERERIKRHMAQAHKHIPDRGTVDEITGETWAGLPGSKLAVNAVGNEELGPAAVQNVNVNDVNATKINAGTLADARIPQLSWGKLSGTAPKGSLPGDINYGRVKAAELDYGEGRPIPSGKVDKGYPYDDLKNPPALGAFVKAGNEFKSEVRKYVKPNALK